MPNAIWMAGYQVCREYVEGNVKSFLVECMTTLDACPKCGVIGRAFEHFHKKSAEYEAKAKTSPAA